MIITRTPFRVSFFGGGSDLAAFYRRSPGAVLSTTIDRYMYLSAHPYFDRHSIHLKYATSELAATVDDVRHPIVRRVLQRLPIRGGIEITSTADIPSGTGLGSSSAFTVGLLNLLYAYGGRRVSAERLAKEACEVEVEDLGEPIGKQDQYASAFGGMSFIRFFSDEEVDVAPLPLTSACRVMLEKTLLMFYTGDQRSASDLLSEQKKALLADAHKFAAVQRMVEMAFEARALLEAEDVPAFGRLLHELWTIKRTMTSSITNARIDEMYDRALHSGAWGGKLLGAGGGGFLLVAAPESAHATIRAALGHLQELPMRFERGGSKVVYMADDA
jgi:D-glycero-alpha-D-manno-heptose-7-phosphate kinase